MSRVSRAFRIAGTVIKLLLTAGVAFVCGLLLWRVFLAPIPPKGMDQLTVNRALAEAYAEQGEDLFLFKQNQNSITRAEKNKGYFSVTDSVVIPHANQIQLLFRYNNSTIRALATDGKVASEDALPARTERIYDVTLVLNLDLTPTNTKDNDGNHPDSVRQVRVHASYEELAQKNMYNYSRLVFDLPEELDLQTLLDEGLLLAVFVDVYYVGDLSYDVDPYGTLCLYDYQSEKISVSPSRAEKKALQAWSETKEIQ